ncbi:MAG: NAD-dependent epimerase/dehydratase family protein [Candidatus Bathyarchaeota archaeon]|nr:NAD-dependent epimerase/dehydratase family protein [Candidatus Bathyarchaeota archaeon]
MPSSNLGKVFITGGAGFIGSHLTNRLCAEHVDVIVFDNLSAGRMENIEKWLDAPNFKFVLGDLLFPEKILESLDNCETVFHFAANPEVKISSENPQVHYEQNVLATFNLLEAVRRTESVKTIVFASSSAVYGDAEEIPTPEDYAPLKPISVYGASKLASEALIISYAYNYGFKTIIYRLANIVGSRARHGIIYDFVRKLKENPERLEILGDGSQKKSYLHVEDCIDAILFGINVNRGNAEIFNVGSEDQITVKEIADIVCRKMRLKGVQYMFTGGVDGGRGWKGDVKFMLLSINKLKKLGWKPKLNSRQAVERAVEEIIKGG